MKPEVQPHSDTVPIWSPVHAWKCDVSLLRDSKLLLPHSLAPAPSLPHCPSDPFLFQLSAQPSLARAAKLCREPSSQERQTVALNIELSLKPDTQHRVSMHSKLRSGILGGLTGHCMRTGWGQSLACHKDRRQYQSGVTPHLVEASLQEVRPGGCDWLPVLGRVPG